MPQCPHSASSMRERKNKIKKECMLGKILTKNKLQRRIDFKPCCRYTSCDRSGENSRVKKISKRTVTVTGKELQDDLKAAETTVTQ